MVEYTQRKSNPADTHHLYNIYSTWPNVFDVGPALYKGYTNILRALHGKPPAYLFYEARHIETVLAKRRASVAADGPM